MIINIDLTAIPEDSFDINISDMGDIEINFGWGSVVLSYDQFDKLSEEILKFNKE